MPSVTRHEFKGDWLVFWQPCISEIGAPFAVIYAINRTVSVTTQMTDAEAALAGSPRGA